MRLLLDTHLLLWTVGTPQRRSAQAAALIEDPKNQLSFSVASIWELAIKRGLNRPNLRADPSELWRELLDHGYDEIPITSAHALAILALKPIHQDPFDRILVAQATVEGLILLTADARMAEYAGPVRLV